MVPYAGLLSTVTEIHAASHSFSSGAWGALFSQGPLAMDLNPKIERTVRRMFALKCPKATCQHHPQHNLFRAALCCAPAPHIEGAHHSRASDWVDVSNREQVRCFGILRRASSHCPNRAQARIGGWGFGCHVPHPPPSLRHAQCIGVCVAFLKPYI